MKVKKSLRMLPISVPKRVVQKEVSATRKLVEVSTSPGEDAEEEIPAKEMTKTTTETKLKKAAVVVAVAVEETEKEEDMKEEDELGNQFSGTAGKLYKKLKQEIETIKGSISKNGNELDWKKYLKLISEYRQFKRNEVQHFRFDSAAQAKTFGKPFSKTF